MRSTVACCLALVHLLGCASGEDKVETEDPAVTQDDVADDDAQGGADDDGLIDPGEQDPATGGDDDADDDAADDDTADDDGAEPEPSSNDDESTGTGGAGNDDDDAQGGTTGHEPDGGSEPDAGGAGGSGGTGGGECPRPQVDYTLLGTDCDLADFDCENYFRDECGCGCDDVSETMCRPDDEYVALGDTCDVVRFTCDDGAYFRDDCGCGCLPIGDSGAEECVAPSGTAIAVTENQIRQYMCFQFSAEPRLIASEGEYMDFVSGCDGAPAEELDFDGHVYFAAVVPERTAVDFAYAVETNDGVHVGVQAQAYCGGAAPPTTVLLIEFDPIDAEFIQDRCDTGMCDPDLLPPSAATPK